MSFMQLLQVGHLLDESMLGLGECTETVKKPDEGFWIVKTCGCSVFEWWRILVDCKIASTNFKYEKLNNKYWDAQITSCSFSLICDSFLVVVAHKTQSINRNNRYQGEQKEKQMFPKLFVFLFRVTFVVFVLRHLSRKFLHQLL